MDKTINNPLQAYRTVTDYRTGLGADGFALDYYNEVIEAVANGTIAVGDLLTLVVPALTTGLRVNKVASGGAGTFLGAFGVVGVCMDAATIGQPTSFCKYGYCLVNVGAGTAAAGDMAVTGATAGQADVIAAATGLAATTFAGNVVGTFLGAKNAANLAPVWVSRL